MPTEKRDTRLTVQLTPTLKMRLERLCGALGWTRAEAITRLVTDKYFAIIDDDSETDEDFCRRVGIPVTN